MDPLKFIAKYCLNKPGRDLLYGYIAERGEHKRLGDTVNRYYYNQLSTRMSRLRRSNQLVEFSTIDQAIAPALRSIGALAAGIGVSGADRAFYGTDRSDSYGAALYSVKRKLPPDEMWRFEPSGDIYSVIESILWGKSLKSPISKDDIFKGAFITNRHRTVVKEVIVYGSLNGSKFFHEIVSFLLNKNLLTRKYHYEFRVGLHARLLWLQTTRF